MMNWNAVLKTKKVKVKGRRLTMESTTIEITDKNKYTAGVVRLTAAAWRPAQCLVDVSNRPGVASEQLQS